MSLRVGLIGARRRRQGLGPFVARYLVGAGCEVPCFVGTSPETVALAAEELRAIAGIVARGYTDTAEMLAAEPLDALAILSPAERHRDGLELALDHDLDVLCEKPFLWGAEDDQAAAVHLVESFADAGRVLRENCQWPFTLPAFMALHPDLADETVTAFEMLMAPSSTGAEMLVDAIPHPTSLLQALAPGEDVLIEDPLFTSADGRGPTADSETLDLAFRWVADGHAVEVKLHLRTTPTQPRVAEFAINGHRARRLIRTSDYALFFADAARLVDVPDPLRMLVEEFVGDVRGNSIGTPAPQVRNIVQRVRVLHEVVDAFRAHIA